MRRNFSKAALNPAAYDEMFQCFSFSCLCSVKKQENNNRELIGKILGTVRGFRKKITNPKYANTYSLLKAAILWHLL